MTERKNAAERRILLGEITGAHGIRGSVFIKSYTAEPADIAAYGPLEDEAGGRPLTIIVERVTAKGVVGRVEGVADRTAAEKLKGCKLYVARARLPLAAAGEYYHTDLVGLAAFDEAGAAIGMVVAVVNYGASDILEVRPAGAKTTELVPFTEAFVRDVDLECGRIVLAMPVESAEEGESQDEAGEDKAERD
jgi:16S rRNA processing protein RimM